MGEQPVDLLSQDSLDAAVAAARRAFESAGDLDELARAKTEQLGDRAPVALARQALSALPRDVPTPGNGSTSRVPRLSGPTTSGWPACAPSETQPYWLPKPST